MKMFFATVLSIVCLSTPCAAAEDNPLFGTWQIFGMKPTQETFNADTVSDYSSKKKDGSLAVSFKFKGNEFSGVLTGNWLTLVTPAVDTVFVAVRSSERGKATEK